MSCGAIIPSYSITGDCSNTNSGGISINITGGTAPYTVFEISSSGLLPTSAATTFYEFSGLSGGSYVLQIQDSCSAITSYYVSFDISTGTTVDILSYTNTICGPGGGGSLQVELPVIYGGCSYYLYEVTSGFIASAYTASNTQTFTNLGVGNYYVIADNSGGCTGSSANVLIMSSTTMDYGLYIIDDASCIPLAGSGKVFVTGVTGTPPITYLWSNGQTGSTATGLTAGYYTVTVTDSYGCSLTSGFTINNIPPVGVTPITYVTGSTCFNSDGAVEVIVTGGTAPYFFSGSNGDTQITFSNSYIFQNLPAGVFNVLVTDSGLCTSFGSVSLLTPNGFSIASITSTNSTCNNNGTINIVVNTGNPGATFSYTLYDSSGNTVTTITTGTIVNFTNLPSDTYVYTINNSGCIFTGTTTINNTSLYSISASTTGTTCGLNNGKVVISASSGGTLPYTYQINGNPTQPSGVFNNLSSGIYTATVTDANGCTQTQNFLITPSSPLFFLTSTVPCVVGNDGEISTFITSGTPPFTYNWSANVGPQTGPVVTGLTVGTYLIEITDANGCVLKRTVTLGGTNLVSGYQIFTLSDSVFINSGISGKRGIPQMYYEGFSDLTYNDYGCVVNSADFILETIVNGVAKQTIFYTSTGIYDYPNDVQWSNAVTEQLLTYPDIGNVSIDLPKNKITISNFCDKIDKSCKQYDYNTLQDAKVIINLLIDYDISCIECNIPEPTQCCPQTYDLPLNKLSTIIDGVSMTAVTSGDVSKITPINDFLPACFSDEANTGDLVALGYNNGPYTYTLNFDTPINNLKLRLINYSSSVDILGNIIEQEILNFTTNSGTPSLTVCQGCCYTISGNQFKAFPTDSSCISQDGVHTEGSAIITIQSITNFTSITITGSSNTTSLDGTLIDLCSFDFEPTPTPTPTPVSGCTQYWVSNSSSDTNARLEFTPCCGETKTSPYMLLGGTGASICSSTPIVVTTGSASIVSSGSCPSC